MGEVGRLGQRLAAGREIDPDAADVAIGEAPAGSVAADVAVAEPAEFDAVTVTRNVFPTSVDTSRYDCPVGPTTQLFPPESHRYH